MSKTIIRKSLLFGITISFVSVFLASCSQDGNDPLNRRPRYLLSEKSGGYSARTPGLGENDTDPFNYYYLGENEDHTNAYYAISLKDRSYSGDNGTIEIPGEVTVQSEGKTGIVTGIWHNAFQACPATKIKLTSNITVIDYEAFLYSKIETINVPYSVEEIGEGAFYACQSLTTATFANNSADISAGPQTCGCEVGGGSGGSGEPTPSTLDTIPSFCFFDCYNMTSLTLPASIKEIRYEAFKGCKTLSSSLYFQDIRVIRAGAFEACESLKNVYIPKSFFDNNGVIEPHAFNYCASDLRFTFCGAKKEGEEDGSLERWIANNNNANWGWFNDRNDPTAVVSSGQSSIYENKYGIYKMLEGDVYVADDWVFTTGEIKEDGSQDATIIEYLGAKDAKHIRVPSQMSRSTPTYVRWINSNVLNDTKPTLERLYLPTTLYALDNYMFDGFTNLYVIDGNQDEDVNNNESASDLSPEEIASRVNDPTRTGCCWLDKKREEIDKTKIKGRIDLSQIVDLEFIGTRAFCNIGETALDKIEYVHLPAYLRAVGPEAFSYYIQNYPTKPQKGTRMQNVTTFKWDYKDDSRLEVIGNNAFWKLGNTSKTTEQNPVKMNYREHDLTTLIFPKSFMGFGLRAEYIDKYKVGQSAAFDNTSCDSSFEFSPIEGGHGDGVYRQNTSDGDNDNKIHRPGHIFFGCPLLSKIVFKGDEENSDQTTDLVIPLQTFVNNDSLETVIFEERKDHTIIFHTQQGKYGQQSFGSTAGSYDISNDFRADPFFQTFILPNRCTYLLFQEYAFAGNARAAIYFSGSLNQEYKSTQTLQSDTKERYFYRGNYNRQSLDTLKWWRKIGDESFKGRAANAMNGYFGYCFADSWQTENTNYTNSFGLDQDIPVYENTYYKDTIDGVNVEIGDPNSTNQLVFRGRYAFLCESNNTTDGYDGKAILTKYRFNLFDTTDLTPQEKDGSNVIAHIPSVVQIGEGNSVKRYLTTEIGDSAFSAAYCDGTGLNPSNKAYFTSVEIPDSITRIGDYAFIRAYGIRKISAYSTTNGVENEPRDYEMPISLKSIGKSAFIFTNVEQILNIPDDCTFFENENNTTSIPSVFCNDLSLRKITFAPKDYLDVDQTSSTYYESTVYSLSPINFSITHDAGIDNSVYIYANFFGDGEKYYKLNWTSGNIWKATLNLPLGTHIYRYVLAPTDVETGWTNGSPNWEDRNALNTNDREIVVSSAGSAAFSVQRNVNYAVYVIGESTNWEQNNNYRLEYRDGVWSGDFENISGEFKYVIDNNGTLDWNSLNANNRSTSEGQTHFSVVHMLPYSVTVYGGFNNWANSDKYELDYQVSSGTWSGLFDISEGDYEFKYVLNSARSVEWDSLNPNGNRTADSEQTVFSINYNGSGSVYITGDFNDWAISKSYLLEEENGVWSGTFDNITGEYKYVVVTSSRDPDSLNSGNRNIAISEFMTNAIYSKSAVTYNKDRLIEVLNRNSDYYECSSKDAPLVLNANHEVDGIVFNGDYKTNPCLYGAFKMGHWISNLIAGKMTKNGSTVLDQGLFSGYYSENNGNIIDQLLYLNHSKPRKFQDNSCELETISGNVLDLAPYSLSGCEKLSKISFPVKTDGKIPAGLLLNAGSSSLEYETPSPSEGGTVLDLTNTGYSEISKEAFKGTKITKLIIPEMSAGKTFKLGNSAFNSCVNLQTIDFSKFKGNKIEIGANCFQGCTSLTTIIWPDDVSNLEVTIGNYAFSGCNNNGFTAISLPAKLSSLGSYAFQNCTKLQTFSFLESGSNNLLTSIKEGAFDGCSSLQSFPFSSFTNGSVKIEKYAFRKAGDANANWSVNLPVNFTSLGEEAFSQSKIESLTINAPTISLGKKAFNYCTLLGEVVFKSTGGKTTLGESSFESCTNLIGVYFEGANCQWVGNNYIFKNCTNLEKLMLPDLFPASQTGHKEFVWNDNKIKIFLPLLPNSTNNIEGNWWKFSNSASAGYVYHLVNNWSDLPDSTSGWYLWTKVDDRPLALGVATVQGNTATFSQSQATLSSDDTWTFPND